MVSGQRGILFRQTQIVIAWITLVHVKMLFLDLIFCSFPHFRFLKMGEGWDGGKGDHPL